MAETKRGRLLAVAAIVGFCLHAAFVIALWPFSEVAADVAWHRMHAEPDYYPGYEGWEPGIIRFGYLLGLVIYVYPPTLLVVASALVLEFLRQGIDFSRQLRRRVFVVAGWALGLSTLAYTLFVLYNTYW